MKKVIPLAGVIAIVFLLGIHPVYPAVGENIIGITQHNVTLTLSLKNYASHTVIRINGNSDFDSLHGVAGGSGTQDDPYIIAGWDIDAHGSGDAIYIGNTTAYFIIENCYLHNASYHSWPYEEGDGIMLYNVINGEIKNNIVFKNWDGIRLEAGSKYNKIENNTLTENGGSGISMRDSCDDNYISNNTAFNNTQNGVWMYAGNYNIIKFNDIYENGQYGIYLLSSSSNNTIFNNLIKNNSEYGLYVDGGSDNNIYLNYFLYNNGSNSTYNASHVQAYDTGTDHYNNSKCGNYWLDWAANNDTNDDNGDGIVDWHYYIDGGSNNDSLPLKYEIPQSPQNLIAKSGNMYVNLSWDPPSILKCMITGYKVYRNGSLLRTIDSSNLYYNDTEVVNGVTYSYYITAVNPVGESEKSNTVEATPVTVPSPPQNLKAVAGDGFVKLSWNPPANNGGSEVTEYRIYRNGSLIASVSSSILNYNDTNVANGITYSYYITAVNSVGESEKSNTVEATPVTVPSPPQNLKAVAGDGFVKLSWNPPANNGGSEVTEYRIYRNGSLIASVSSSILNYNDTNVANGITYSYYITAVNSVGESEKSNTVEATPVTVPSPPQNLTAVAEDGFVKLSWNPPANDGGSEVTEYRIYRNGSLIAVVATNTSSYNDYNVKMGGHYSYYVTAVNSKGESSPSNVVYVHTPINVSKSGGMGLLWMLSILGIVIAAVIIILVLMILKRKKMPEE